MPTQANRCSSTDLPTPAERPDADVVVYDGDCVFCESQVRRLWRWDRNSSLAFVSLHDDYVKERCADLSHEQLMKQIYILCSDGRRFAGAGAVRYLSRRLRPLWLIMPLLHIPFTEWIWQGIYLRIAKRRYKIAGKKNGGCADGSCEIHFGEK